MKRTVTKLMKRCVSIIAVAAMIISFAAVSTMAENVIETSLLEEDFTTKTAVAKGEYWGNSVKLVSVVGDTPTINNNYLSMKTGNMLQFHADEALSGKYVIELSFMQQTVGSAKALLSLCNANGAELVRIANTTGGIWVAEGGNYGAGFTLTAGQWHNMKILLDAENSKYDLYIDGKINKGKSYEGTIQRFKLDLGDTQSVATNFDNFSIKKVDEFVTYAAEASIMDEDFTKKTVVTKDEYWGNGVKLVSIYNTTATVNNNYLTVARGGFLQFHSDNALTDKYVIELSFMQETATSAKAFLGLCDTNGGYLVRVATVNGSIYVLDKDGGFYPGVNVTSGKWHNLKIVLDGANNKYDMYIDGKIKQNRAYDGTVQRFKLDLSDGTDSATNFDNFKVYKETPVSGNTAFLEKEDFFAMQTIPVNTYLRGNNVKVVSSNGASIENGSLKINKAESGISFSNIYADYTGATALTDNVVVEFDFTRGSGSVDTIYAAGNSSSQPAAQIRYNDSDKKFYYLYNTGKWNDQKAFLDATKDTYHFKLYINKAAQTYSVYADDVLYVKEATFQQQANGAGINRIFMTQNSVGTHYIDNLVIYNDSIQDKLYTDANAIPAFPSTVAYSSEISMPAEINGSAVKWSVPEKQTVLTADGAVTPANVNVRVYATAALSQAGRSWAKDFTTAVLGNIDLKASFDGTNVVASAYRPGVLYQRLDTTPTLVLAVYQNDAIVAVKSANTNDGDYYKATIDVSELEKGNYQMRAFLIDSFTTLDPICEATDVKAFVIE